jgi:hypothetical protein
MVGLAAWVQIVCTVLEACSIHMQAYFSIGVGRLWLADVPSHIGNRNLHVENILLPVIFEPASSGLGGCLSSIICVCLHTGGHYCGLYQIPNSRIQRSTLFEFMEVSI